MAGITFLRLVRSFRCYPSWYTSQARINMPSDLMYKWRETLKVPPNQIEAYFNPYAKKLYGSMYTNDFYESLKIDGLSNDEKDRVMSHLISQTSKLKGLDPRILANLERMQIEQLTLLQQYLYALYYTHNRTPLNCGLNTVVLNSFVGLDDIVAYLLPILNNLLTHYPSEAMHLAGKAEDSCQYPSAVILVPSFGQIKMCDATSFLITYQSCLQIATSSRRAEACHVLIGRPIDILYLVLKKTISLKACQHLVINNVDKMNELLECIHELIYHGLCTSSVRQSTIFLSQEPEVSAKVSSLLYELNPKTIGSIHPPFLQLNLKRKLGNVDDSSIPTDVSHTNKFIWSQQTDIFEMQWSQPGLFKNSESQRFSQERRERHELLRQNQIDPESSKFIVEDYTGEKLTDLQNILVEEIDKLPNLNPFIRNNFFKMGIQKLTYVEQYIWAIFHRFLKPESLKTQNNNWAKLNLVLQNGNSCLDSQLSYLLPIVNAIANKFPRRANELYRSHNAKILFPSVLIIVPSTTYGLTCITELFWLTHGSNVSVILADPSRRASFDCNILIGSPSKLIECINQGQVSLEACRHLVVDSCHRLQSLQIVQDIIQHRDAGMINCPDRETFLFLTDLMKDRQELNDLFSGLFPIDQTVSSSTNGQNFGYINALFSENLPTSNVRYVFNGVGDMKKALRLIKGIIQTNDDQARILIIWNGHQVDYILKKVGIQACSKDIHIGVKYQEFRSQMEDFRCGRIRILLLNSKVLEIKPLPLPPVNVLMHYNPSTKDFSSYLRLHQLLKHQTNSLSVTMLPYRGDYIQTSQKFLECVRHAGVNPSFLEESAQSN